MDTPSSNLSLNPCSAVPGKWRPPEKSRGRNAAYNASTAAAKRDALELHWHFCVASARERTRKGRQNAQLPSRCILAPQRPRLLPSAAVLCKAWGRGEMVQRVDQNGANPSPERRPVLFALGRLVATPGALEAIDRETALKAIRRHATGDWGELDAEDKAANDAALKSGGRLLSRYLSAAGEPFWIITEADRSATTVLLPDEY